ncbi:RNA polymerase, sigma 54 subunit, RpoN [Clostridium sp. DL-VIII]|uniref:RNA polymerase factor sigma-54 n=1 Tax=Clostridium sp. DL-VIII TaxID=641107 RepID=UPI00023B03BB|nr:RNA polymerase factor sigma-54 [Clostridium sp. DL-VIII]EHJ01857.1 RNA polymerase, sigma 54 subunit, RpoN [Clostridium sp. DL-VIII]
MNIEYGMKMTQEQRLILTQNMQQSIKLLQMSLHDLREYIDIEYSENPVLEINEETAPYDDVQNAEKMSIEDSYDHKKIVEELYSDNYKDKSEINYSNEEISPLNFIEKKMSLKEYLQEQLVEADIDQYMLNICKYIVESLDNKGYLEISVEELGQELNISEEIIERALKIVQSLEPYGIGARNIKECLLIQSLRLNILDNIMEKMILNHLENVAENKYEAVGRALNISPREAQRYGDLIKKLEPKPSRGFYTGEEVNYIIPDAEIKNINDEFFIIMNESALPKLMINRTYKDVLQNNKDSEINTYVKDKINKAIFLIKSIEQRKGTLYKVLECLIDRQKDFFKFGRQQIKPLTLKEVSEKINLHESTVSRAIKDKYILTSYGTIKIKDLFATGLSSNNDDMATVKVKNEIKRIIDEENSSKPLSDQIISSMLADKDMKISRRTVAKYREELGIKSSSMRKRL